MRFRCSEAGEERGDLLPGTASTVRAFVLVEHPGPWGVDAIRDSRLPVEVKTHLGTIEQRQGVRPLLIRGHRARKPHVFAAYVGAFETRALAHRPPSAFLETTRLDDVRELLDLDFTGLAEGGRPGLDRHDEPVFLVCTHGKHDACCAERGRPLWQAMYDVAPEATYQVSHIGGDRFAANLLVLPHGLYYGRLTPADAAAFVDAHSRGLLDLDHLRGRSSLPFAAQAAEIFLRRHLGMTAVDLPELVARDGDSFVFNLDAQNWEVRLERRTSQAQLTCRAETASTGLRFELVSVRRSS